MVKLRNVRVAKLKMKRVIANILMMTMMTLVSWLDGTLREKRSTTLIY